MGLFCTLVNWASTDRSTRKDQRKQLLILHNKRQIGQCGPEPTIKAVAHDAAREVPVTLQFFVVCPHVRWRPRVIAGKLLDVRPIALVRIWNTSVDELSRSNELLTNGDHSVVGCASAQSPRPRIEDSKRLGSLGWILAHVLVTSCSLPHHLGISLLPTCVCIVVDVVVPLHGGVFCGLQLHRRHHLRGCVALVITSFDQQDLVTSESKTSCQRTPTRPGADDNVFILGSRIDCTAGVVMDVSLLIMQRARWYITAGM